MSMPIWRAAVQCFRRHSMPRTTHNVDNSASTQEEIKTTVHLGACASKILCFEIQHIDPFPWRQRHCTYASLKYFPRCLHWYYARSFSYPCLHCTAIDDTAYRLCHPRLTMDSLYTSLRGPWPDLNCMKEQSPAHPKSIFKCCLVSLKLLHHLTLLTRHISYKRPGLLQRTYRYKNSVQ